MVSIFSILSSLVNATDDRYPVNVPAEASPTSSYSEFMANNAKKMNEKGYIESFSTKYAYLNGLEDKIQYESQGDIQNTDLRKNMSEIVTCSTLKTVPNHSKSQSIGYAPIGSYNKDLGWTGITEIFKAQNIGICQFLHLDLKAGNGGYSLQEEGVRRDVNNKSTIVEVTGQEGQGFDYEITWFGNFNMYTLNCINQKYSKTFRQKVINLAKEIDAN